MTTLYVEDIKKLIPHRYPFLFIDRIEDIVPMEAATGIKNVTINEPFFQGHFPDFPIMPGVLIIEAMAQTAGALVCHSLGQASADKPVFFMSIEEAKFRKPVLPGHVLHLKVKKIQNRSKIWKFRGEACVDGVVHCESTFMAMIG